MFKGHNKDVLSVAFSADNRQIVSGSRDKTIKLWNTLGVCKYTIQVCETQIMLYFLPFLEISFNCFPFDYMKKNNLMFTAQM